MPKTPLRELKPELFQNEQETDSNDDYSLGMNPIAFKQLAYMYFKAIGTFCKILSYIHLAYARGALFLCTDNSDVDDLEIDDDFPQQGNFSKHHSDIFVIKWYGILKFKQNEHNLEKY